MMIGLLGGSNVGQEAGFALVIRPVRPTWVRKGARSY